MNDNTNEAPAQDVVPAGIRKVMRCSQLQGLTPRDSKIITDAAGIYASGFSQGYIMGKDEMIAEQ